MSMRIRRREKLFLALKGYGIFKKALIRFSPTFPTQAKIVVDSEVST